MKGICRSSEDKFVSDIEFSIYSEEEIAQQSHVKLTNAEFYNPDKTPTENGVLDPKLGVSKNVKCETCGEIGDACLGHLGYIRLSQHIFPYPYLRDIVKILKSICKVCGHILLKYDEKRSFDKKLGRRNITYITKKKIRKEVIVFAKKMKCCLNCNSSNGDVKKVQSLSMVVHKKFTLKRQMYKHQEMCQFQPDKLKDALSDGYEILRPYEVHKLFTSIPVEHFKYLGITRKSHHKIVDLIFRNITVPPNCIRLSEQSLEGSREDSLSLNLKMMILQKSCNDLHNDFTKMIKPSAAIMPNRDEKHQRGIAQRLSGKKGRFRGNLMGKRTNFTARTVISPDPTLAIDEISIPEHCALILTFTERVTTFNIDYLRKAILNGPFKHPGALRVLKAEGKSQEYLMGLMNLKLLSDTSHWNRLRAPKRREIEAKDLKIGDFVERHIHNGDIVLFNRQPSLHRLSFQSFKIVVKKSRTFSFNPCCCNPFNADFDGDEMNIHFPQTYESMSECKILISSLNNVTSPNSGEPLTSPLQDILTAAYLLTSKDVFFTKSQFLNLAMQMLHKYNLTSSHLENNQQLNLPPPAILRPQVLYTGKQLISMIISPYANVSNSQIIPDTFLNLTIENKAYKTGEKELSTNDGYVVIQGSELLQGQLDKKLLGGGSKSSIFYRLIHDSNEENACRVMERICQVSLRYLQQRGFTIGLVDVTPSSNLLNMKLKLVRSNFDKCDLFVRDFEARTLPCDPGCSLEETLESKQSEQLSKIRDEGGRACLEALSKQHNAPLIMAICGSKGSFINISQMVFCVGQQIINGKRVGNVMANRTLPLCHINCKKPKSLGFVENSFYSGLNNVEFVFHSMSGREGLVDTAVKTAETGYMQRRLIKCLEDITVMWDTTVRDVNENIIQFKYGNDGFDPAKMDANNLPCDLYRELDYCLTKNIDYSHAYKQWKLVEIKLIGLFTHFKFQEYEGLTNQITETVKKYCESINGRYMGITDAHLTQFLERVYKKYVQSHIVPGTPVGVICGQSVGEPATQMTLKTFHFAGVASMSVTRGVPRMTEILNAVKEIKTPITTVKLMDEYKYSESIAKLVQSQIQPLFFRDIIQRGVVKITSGMKFYMIELDTEMLRTYFVDKIKLAVTVGKLKIAKVTLNVIKKGDDHLFVEATSEDDFEENQVMKIISLQQISGLANVRHTVIQKAQDGEYNIFVEGGKISDFMALRYVDGEKCVCNHILEMNNIFGIEAGFQMIIDELQAVMGAHNLTPDMRHVLLLADAMTTTGSVQGFQRSGMEKSKNSVLCLASFERTMDHLVEASYHSQKDKLSGITDCIAFGKTIPLGTGMTQVMLDKSVNMNESNGGAKKRKFILN